jgi:hypothetical protein
MTQLDPLILNPSLGAVIEGHWIELPIAGPADRNVLVLVGGVGIITEGTLDTEDEDETADTHIWIETGYEFADGDSFDPAPDAHDVSAAVQLASINVDGSDPFTLEISKVQARKISPLELATIVLKVGQESGQVEPGPGTPGPATSNDELVIIVTVHQSGDCSLQRLGYRAAVRLFRVDPNRRVSGPHGDLNL